MMRESGVTEIDWLLPPEIHHPDGKAFDWNDCLCEYGRREVRIRIMEQLTMVT
jgi:hypothetical protein